MISNHLGRDDTMERIKTGVDGLDDIIEGFPKGKTILITGDPGCGKTIFSLAFIPLYNLLAPADMKRTLSEALVLPLTRLVVPPAGLLVIAILMALFALLTLPGPVARARRMARRIEKEKKETETA